MVAPKLDTFFYLATGFFAGMGVGFLLLRLLGEIDCSWWIVLLPIYGPLSIAICLLVILKLYLGDPY